jgi:hypothetical protein
MRWIQQAQDIVQLRTSQIVNVSFDRQHKNIMFRNSVIICTRTLTVHSLLQEMFAEDPRSSICRFSHRYEHVACSLLYDVGASLNGLCALRSPGHRTPTAELNLIPYTAQYDHDVQFEPFLVSGSQVRLRKIALLKSVKTAWLSVKVVYWTPFIIWLLIKSILFRRVVSSRPTECYLTVRQQAMPN